MALYELYDKIKRYLRFSKEEVSGIIITMLITAFIVSFSEWGPENTFDASVGIRNLFLSAIVVSLVMLVHLAAQALVALNIGFKIKYKMLWPGLLIGLVIIFVSRGKLWFLAPGGIFLEHLTAHRLGVFRYGINLWAAGMVSLAGVAATMSLSLVFKILLEILPANPFLQKALSITIWYAVFSMLPIPPLDGSRIFYAMRGAYLLILGIVIGWAGLIKFASILVTIIGSVAIGVIAGVVYYHFFERTYWQR